jgi:hypothetical protein
VAAGGVIVPGDLGLAGDGADTFGEAGSGPSPDRVRIEAALRAADGVVSRAARRLGISRQALYRRMDRLGIVIERRPRSAPADEA